MRRALQSGVNTAMFPALSDRARGTPSPYTAETQAWLVRVAANGGTATTTQIAALDLLVLTYLALGLTDATCRLNAYCGQSLAAALVPVLRGGGPDVDTNVNFVAGDYTPSTGLTGDAATKYINTGVAPSSLGGDDSQHIGVWSMGLGNRSNSVEMGAMDAIQSTLIRSILTVNQSTILTGSDIFTFNGRVSAGYTTVKGFVCANRVTIGTGGLSLYLNGTLIATGGDNTFLSRPTYPYFVHNRSIGLVPDVLYSNRPLGGYTLGARFDNAQAGTLSTAWSTYQTAMGRAV